jgi:hypothetical protein
MKYTKIFFANSQKRDETNDKDETEKVMFMSSLQFLRLHAYNQIIIYLKYLRYSWSYTSLTSFKKKLKLKLFRRAVQKGAGWDEQTDNIGRVVTDRVSFQYSYRYIPV